MYIHRFWGLRGHIVDQDLIRNGARTVPDAIWKDLEGSLEYMVLVVVVVVVAFVPVSILVVRLAARWEGEN